MSPEPQVYRQVKHSKTMELITNNHAHVINELILNSNKIILCSGWLNTPGINKIYKNLVTASENDTEIRIYSNSKHTTTDVEKLISKCNKIKHVVVNNKNKYLHSKIYYFEDKESYTAIIGSANLTKGGLGNNEELSVLLSGKINSNDYLNINSYLRTIEKLR